MKEYILIVILSTISFAWGMYFGVSCIWREYDKMKQIAIEKGFAEYNRKTGEWQWVSKGEKE